MDNSDTLVILGIRHKTMKNQSTHKKHRRYISQNTKTLKTGGDPRCSRRVSSSNEILKSLSWNTTWSLPLACLLNIH